MSGSSQTFKKIGDSDGYQGNRLLSTDTDGNLKLVRFPQSFQTSGSWVLNGNWVTFSRRYGYGQENFNQASGSGVEPSYNWQDRGVLIPKGAILKRIIFIGRKNNTDGGNIEIYIGANEVDLSDDISFDSTGEMNLVEVLGPTELDLALVNRQSADMWKVEASLGDYEMLNETTLHLWLRPVSAPATTRQLRAEVKIEWEIPLNA